MRRYILFMVALFVGSTAMAQRLPERREVRQGNKEYVGEKFDVAAERYTKAMELAPECYEARYNLGSALIKGEKFEEGEKLLAELAADSLLGDTDRSQAYFNLGNSQFAQQKLKEALESYKSSMRFDPTDQEAKYNYAYTKAMLEQQQQNEEQNKDQQNEDQQNQDENQDQQDQNKDQQDQGDQDQEQNQDQQDQEQDQDQDKGEDQQDQGDQEENQDQQDQQDQQGEAPQPSGIPEQEREQMLDAIQAQEDKTQDDLKEKAQGVVIPSAKNW